jgi:hypothetical protein
LLHYQSKTPLLLGFYEIAREVRLNLSGGGELHLTITALKINGLPGINDTINIGDTNLTFTHGILTGYG